MIISETFIKSKCMLSTTYPKGLRLYKQNYVHDISIEKLSNNMVRFMAEVDGKVTASYDVSFVMEADKVNNTIGFNDYECTCPAFDSYGGFCKHMTAAAMKINDIADFNMVWKILENNKTGTIYRYKGDDKEKSSKKASDYYQQSIFSDEKAGHNAASQLVSASGRTFSAPKAKVKKKTSPKLMEAIRGMRQQERSRFCREIAGGDIELEVTLHLEKRDENIDLRIGKEKKYVVKNISELIDNIKNERYVSYGKNLSIVHSQSAFTKISQDVIALLMENIVQDDYEAYGYAYKSRATDKRYFSLDDKCLDRLMEIYAGKSIYVEFGLTDGKHLTPIRNENPVLPVSISEKKGTGAAKIKFPDILLLEGVKKYYVWWKNVIYICSEEYCRDMSELLKLMTLNTIKTRRSSDSYVYYRDYILSIDNQIMELSEEDYAAFSATLLPVMEKYMKVDIKGTDFSKYHMAEGVYEIYLDINKNQEIICNAQGIYDEKKHNLITPALLDENYRDIKNEYEICALLGQYFPEKTEDGEGWLLRNDDDRLAALVEYGVNQLKNLSEVYVSDAFKKIRIANKIKVTTGVSIKGNLLNVSWNVDGMTDDELYDILGAYKRKKKYYRLKNGELLSLSDSGIEAFAEIQEDLKLTKAELKTGMTDVPMYRALYLDSVMRENADKMKISMDKSFEKFIASFEEKKRMEYKLPKEINADMRPYQMEGYRWASLLSEMGFGGILADDMGLGKTLQMIAFMRSKTGEPHIVICPASLVYNWAAELLRFAPDMKVCTVIGSISERQALLEKYMDYDVILTSYDLLKRDIEAYDGKKFYCQIIDEAQNIKNPATQVAKAVKSINSKTRFALTGTPIENRLSELWSIFEYLMPGYLYSYKHFRESFEERITNKEESNKKEKDSTLTRLHKMISPFMLRRLKKDVLKELPDKIEKVVYSGFDAEQEKLYRAVEKNMIDSLRKKTDSEFKENKLLILAELTKLRQICCDPSLIYENYSGKSAKLDTCMELIESAIEGGHRILLFSQFASMIKTLGENLEKRGIRTMTITGSTSKVKRRQLVDSFQEGNGDVFLVSLKAGGTGLNLTAADMVIHYDPWWNVAAQNQATDRAHRIGQENNVTVVKLIAKNTIEERILRLQEMKQDLADRIICEEGVGITSMSKEELLGLFGKE